MSGSHRGAATPRTRRLGPPLFAALTLVNLCLVIGACRRSEPQVDARVRVRSEPARSAATTERMRQLEALMRELHRRVRGKAAPSAVGRRIVALAQALARAGQPAGYLAACQRLVKKAEALPVAKPAPRAAFRALVGACVACHRQYAPEAVKRIETLQLSGTDHRGRVVP